MDGKFHWRYNTQNLLPDEDVNIEVRFYLPIRDTPTPQKTDALKTLLKYMANNEADWVVPGRRDWVFNLSRMTEMFPDLQEFGWCKGTVFVEPEFEVHKEEVDISNKKYYETFIVFYINPEVLGVSAYPVPPDIQQSSKKFQAEHPDPNKVAFVMMRFGTTPAHDKIIQGIRDTLAPHGIKAVRAAIKSTTNS